MLYIQSRADMTLGVIEEFYNDTHQMILSSGVSSYTFTVAKNIEDSQYLVEGNYVIITDDQGLGWKFTIMNTTQTHTEITVYCEDIGLELVNKVMDAWNAPTTKQPASYYINKAIKDTKWKIGFNQISNLSRTLKWEGRDTSLNRLLSICTEFDHAEIEFRVKFHNLQVTDYIINIYKSRGANRSDIQLVYGETVNDITKTSSIEELATAMMGVGSDKELPENAPQGTIPDKVTFKNLTYDDGFFFTKAGDPFLRARVANQQFNLREGYIEDYYEYDTSDPQELLNRTITQLKERSEIKVNYEVSAVKFDKSLQLGDTITIIDHDYKPELLLSGRVLELDKSYTDASQDKLVLGNFLILYSNINDKLYNLQNQIKNMKVDSNYMWLRYAIDDKGTGMSATPTAGTKYFAMLVNKKTGVPSDNPADYTGHWKLIQGEDGKNGVAGPKGEDGKTSYTHFAYADNVSGTADFSLDDPTGRSYMGVYSDFTKADGTNPDDYIWSLTKGESGPEGMQGAQGPKGDIGIPGKPGTDGKTSYTHVAYADNDEGGGFSQNPTNKAYMGWYSDFTQVDSTDTTKYAWSLIKGSDGLDGAQGIPGPKGADGKTPYTHIAYADTAIGGGLSQLPDGKKYIGMYVDFTENDSSDPQKYAWSLIKGADGKDGTPGKDGIAGKDGVGVKATAIAYAQSTSGATPPTIGWTAGVPTLIKGQYLWTRTVWTYTDSTTETGYTVSYNAKDGNNGSDGVAGKDGVGISNTIIEYVGAVYGNSTPVSGWSTTIPTVPAGQYLWTRTTWQYTDGTSEQGFTNALMGRSGDKGDPGNQGIPGKPGADGRTPYTHWAYGWSADGKDGFTTVYPNLNLLTGTSDIQDYTLSGSGWALGSQSSNGTNASIPCTPGESYTYSVIVKSTTYDCYPEMQFFDSGKNFILNSANVPGKDIGMRKTTEVAPENVAFMRARMVLKNPPDLQTVVFNSEKLELGSTTTPWTPSPLDDPEGAYPTFIGTYTDYTVDDSTDPSKYTWAKLRGEQGMKGDTGEDGVAGKDGVGLKSTQIMYAQNTSGTTAPTTGWTAQVPTLIKGQYLWTQTTWLYTDNTGEAGYTVSYNAKDGNTGSDGRAGKDGVGIKSTTITYASSTSGTSAPTSGWVSTPPSAAAGQFIWTRTIWTYTDNTTETGYSVGKIGEKGSDGANGIPGKPGADGRTPYFHTAWADSMDGKINFSLTDATNRGYLGTYTDFTQADSTDTTKYAWSLIKGRDGSNGAPGKPGADGKTPYFHQAWADSKDGKINFSTTDPTNRGYLGTYSDFTQADSTDPTKYFWVELVGSLKIGGTNLAEGTSRDWKKITTSGWGISNLFPMITNIVNGEEYVISVEVRNVTQPIMLETWMCDANGSRTITASQTVHSPIGNQVTTLSAVFTANVVAPNVAFYPNLAFQRDLGATVGSYEYRCVKFERGNKATDWSPAPEDTQQQIDSVNQALVQTNNKINEVPHVSAQASAPTSPKKGDQWWVLDASGKATGFKVWNGTAWNDSKIQQSLLNVVSLNAVTITGSTINGSKFTNNFDFTNAEKIQFQGVTTIGDGAINITWKIPANNQTGQTLLNASGFQSVVNDSAGAIINRTDLLFGELDLKNRTSGTGATSKYVWGSLTAQDVYRGDTTAVQWLSGWGDWGNGNGLIHVTRNGYTVSVSGYPHHNNSENFAEVATLPAWARPPKTVNLSGTIYDSGVMNPAACKITIDQNGKIQVTNGKKGGYLIIGGTYVGQNIV